MRFIIVLSGLIALAMAKGVGADTPPGTETDTEYEYPMPSSDASTIDFIPTPSGYPAHTSSSILAIPSDSSAEASTSIEECSTLSTTVTLTQTIPIATVIPSSLASVTGAIDLSSWVPSQPQSQPNPFFSTTMQQSSAAEPVESSPAPTLPLVSETSTAEVGGESSVDAPLSPEPTFTGKPVEGTGTTTTFVGGSETGSHSLTTASEPALFTDAAGTLGVPRMVVGVVGWAALVL